MLTFSDNAILRVAEHFDAKTFHRGLQYAMDERVALVKADEFPIVAKVRGAETYVVTVDCGPSGDWLRGSCSCPVAVDCKHAAAAAIVAFQLEEEGFELQEEDYQAQVVGEWLADLGHEVTEAAAPAPSAILAYLLGDADYRTTLSFHRTKILKRGGLARSSTISIDSVSQSLPSWISSNDLRLMMMVRSLARASSGEASLGIEFLDASIFEELAATRRLYWRDVHGMSLRWGEPRSEQLGWREIPGQDQLFRLGLDAGLVLLAAREPLYVDIASRSIGLLQLGLPASVVQKLVRGPGVPRSMLATAEISLRGILLPEQAELLFPEPVAIPEGPKLRPLLAVDIERRRGHSELVLRSEAVYGDVQFPLAAWGRSRGEQAQEIVRSLAEEGRYLAQLDALIEAAPIDLSFSRSGQEFLQAARYIAQELVPALSAQGWLCEVSEDVPAEVPLMPTEWVQELRPVSSEHAWFSFGIGVSIDGRQIDLLPMLLAAIRDGRINFSDGEFGRVQAAGINVTLPSGEQVYVPKDRLQRWVRPLVELRLRGLNKDQELLIPSVSAPALFEEQAGEYSESAALARVRKDLAALTELAPRQESKGFVGELRPYQRQGLAWLRFLHDAGYGGLLCDDMGLGKTVQLLAFAEGLRAARKLSVKAPMLVVAPRSVVGNWHFEAGHFTPKLKSIVHLGSSRARSVEELLKAPLILTSYQTLLRDIEILSAIPWTSVIFDEAQAIKNPDTKLRRAVQTLKAHSRFCVSGTPIENHLGEIWSQADLVMPGLLGSKSSFRIVFRSAIEKYGNTEALDLLRKRLRPFLLRRSKAQVDVELPEKTEIVERISFDTAQRDLYESLRIILDKEVRDALKERGVQASSLIILDALLRLRQCCCDPRLLKTAQSERVKSSAKLEKLMSMLDELVDAGRSVLVFSQFTSMLEIIEAECEKADIGYLKLTGATRDRESIIRRFQDGEAPVFLISLKAGGVGLNLTRADTVIHYDPWWNPAVERQATDRAHRIGQDKKVMVYKLVARDTLEERISVMQSQKQELTDSALFEGGVSHLDAEDLQALFHSL